ncbi:MAG: Ribosome hibernation promoting factor [Planctomycetota bacterium]|jgi:putative sigma-54 modulation protein
MTNDEELTIEFKGRHDHISERMKAHATKKLEKLARYNDRIARIELVADHAHESPEVELIVHMRRGKPMVAKDQGETFSATVDSLVVKMEKQLKKQKEKRTDHKIPGAKGAVAAPARKKAAKSAKKGKDEETYEEVVRKTLRG